VPMAPTSNIPKCAVAHVTGPAFAPHDITRLTPISSKGGAGLF
jgi:hypothetical protein